MEMSAYLSIIARVLILNQMAFIQVLQELSTAVTYDTFKIFGELLDVWLRKMPLIGQPDKRKLSSELITITLQVILIYANLRVS